MGGLVHMDNEGVPLIDTPRPQPHIGGGHSLGYSVNLMGVFGLDISGSHEHWETQRGWFYHSP